MQTALLVVSQSLPLMGTTFLLGSKNAVLVILASLILTKGTSKLRNVPFSADVLQMTELLRELGAEISIDYANHEVVVNTALLCCWTVRPELMRSMRASIFVMGPLLARFSKAEMTLPGGDAIGARPIDLHLKGLAKMGATVFFDGIHVQVRADQPLAGARIVLDYPSVGATENILMAAVCTAGITQIVNAALEPQILDLIVVLQKMGACISIHQPAMIEIQGVDSLSPIDHEIMPDWLEAGTLLMAAAATGGEISLPQARAIDMELVLEKLQEMGHEISIGDHGLGVTLRATKYPKAVSFKTGPYPGFSTDLQAPMMALQCCAQGISVIEETVFENRFRHVSELQKMGAEISVVGNKAIITGVPALQGAAMQATDIRACSALAIAGLMAHGITTISNIYHWSRGHEKLEERLSLLGGSVNIVYVDDDEHSQPVLVHGEYCQKITEL